MTIKTGLLKWDITELVTALKIKASDVHLYFTDGRRVSFLLERRVAYEILNGSIASSEGASYDVIDNNGGKWEVRSISRSGIYFCPSYMVGSGRSFDETGFLEKLEEIKGYVVADIESFPNVPFWFIPKEQVLSWWESGKLGTSSKISRKTAFKLLKSIGYKV